MPSAPPFAQPSSSHALFPALYLYPLNDSFVPKHISLAHGQRVKIGRQTNAKTAPGERNGFFDSKVLSRQHAEVWEESGRIFIKDVKSSNGTFINGERLSPEAEESKPWELKSDDIVEFGIDIVGEDNKTIIHHKVAARVVCVFTEQDAQVAARAEQHAHYNSQSPSPSSSSNVQGGFSFGPAPQQQQQQQQQQQRRQPIQAALTGMGGMGGSMRPPGKSGLTFDHILSRLQGELQKSRETGAELNTLTNTMGEIHETLGGSLPNTLPPYPATLPPVRPPQAPSPPQQQSSNTSPQPAPNAPSTALLTELQSQLASTQSNLAAHVEKIRALEGMLAEQETIKREMRILREMVEFRKEGGGGKGKGRYEEEEHELEEESDDDDDARSVSTVIPHELERVDEVDEEQEDESSSRSEQSSSDRASEHEQEQETEEQEHARRRDEAESAGRPHTPEPTNLGISIRSNSNTSSGGRSGSPLSQTTTAEDDRLTTLHNTVASLTSQVSSIVSFTSTLESQHTAAQETIRTLESKVESLELVLREVRAEQTRVAEAEESRLRLEEERKVRLDNRDRSEAEEKESLTTLITTWKKSVEGQWSSIREEWAQERERLSKAREEWEVKAKAVDVGVEKMSRFVDEQTQHARESHAMGNGDARMHSGNGHGLVTPPSPRSQSSDSGRYRRRRKGASSRSRSRGRSRSHSPNAGDGEGEEHTLDTDTDTTLASEDNAKSGGAIHGGKEKQKGLSMIPERSLATPEPSLYTDTVASGEDESQSFGTEKIGLSKIDHTRGGISYQTAFGVLVLSAAAAAVLWRVKPE